MPLTRTFETWFTECRWKNGSGLWYGALATTTPLPQQPSRNHHPLSSSSLLAPKVQLDVSTIMSNGEIDVEKIRNHARNYHVGSYLGTPYSITGPSATPQGEIRQQNPYSVDDWRGLLETIHHVYEQENQFPPIYGVDSVHGANYVDNATIFPQQVGMGATFNRDLALKFGEVTAKDTRATGIPWTFTPILDIGMQPSWPRMWETISEDPFLTAELGKYVIHGIQGFDNNLTDTTKIAACMKHFLGYGDSRSGHDRTPSWIPDRFLLGRHNPTSLLRGFISD
jgi:beta-glucosidase